MAKGLADILVDIAVLFVRELDIQADTGRFAKLSAVVGRFHDTGTTAGNYGKTRIGQLPGNLLGQFIVWMLGERTRTTENAYSGLDRTQAFRRFDKFCHNSEHAPRFARRPGLFPKFVRHGTG
jgi:hypothetical protein